MGLIGKFVKKITLNNLTDLNKSVSYSSKMYDHYRLLYMGITQDIYFENILPELIKADNYDAAKKIVDNYIQDKVVNKN